MHQLWIMLSRPVQHCPPACFEPRWACRNSPRNGRDPSSSQGQYLKQSGLTNKLSKTVEQMAETRYSTVSLTLELSESVYSELQAILKSLGESQRLHDVSPDVWPSWCNFCACATMHKGSWRGINTQNWTLSCPGYTNWNAIASQMFQTLLPKQLSTNDTLSG